ncbi:protein tyrosine kinase [Cooperia oncophora]
MELRHIPIKYSRRAKLYYVRLYGFKLVSGLIEYHRRNKIAFDEDGTMIKRAIKRAEWQLNHEQIVKTKKLGDGAFGDVYKGVLHCGLIDSKEVAIKTILGTVSTEENEKLFREAMLMRRLVHPNVVMLVGVASNEEPVMIVMEFAPGGSVLDAVQQQPGPTIYVRIKYCNHAALGLNYLSKQGIIHRDVAARNCLIGKNDTAKISDFGLSIVGTQKKEKTLKKVPVRYLAPETLKKREYTVKTDVWSFGVFMWEVFHDGREPYGEMNAKEVRKYVLGGNTLDNESDHYPQQYVPRQSQRIRTLVEEEEGGFRKKREKTKKNK